MYIFYYSEGLNSYTKHSIESIECMNGLCWVRVATSWNEKPSSGSPPIPVGQE